MKKTLINHLRELLWSFFVEKISFDSVG
jgi:hypothetical protein